MAENGVRGRLEEMRKEMAVTNKQKENLEKSRDGLMVKMGEMKEEMAAINEQKEDHESNETLLSSQLEQVLKDTTSVDKQTDMLHRLSQVAAVPRNADFLIKCAS